MSDLTIDITPASRDILHELSEKMGQPMSEVLAKALDAYRRDVFFEEMAAGYTELRADRSAWAAHEAERRNWDETLVDGMDADERWTPDGHERTSEPNGAAE